MKLHANLTGFGEPIVLLHGLLASSHYWERVIDKLDPSSYQTLAIDMLGFGQSPKPHQGYDIDNYTKLVIETINDSKIKTPITLVGHSMGSLVAAHIALGYPRLIKHLILISPPFYTSPEQAREYIEKRSPYAKLFRSETLSRASCWLMCHMHKPLKVVLPALNRSAPKKVAQDLLQHNWHSYSGTFENLLLNQNYLLKSRLKVRTTVLYGSKDKLIVPENIHQFSDKAKKQN